METRRNSMTAGAASVEDDPCARSRSSASVVAIPVGKLVAWPPLSCRSPAPATRVAGAGRSARGVGPGRLGVVALRADRARERAARVLPRAHALERRAEVVARRPAE